jgi:hypothetical protein
MVEPGSEPESPGPEEGGGQPNSNPPAAIPPATTLPAPVKPVVRKPHCGKAKKLKKVRGKWRCVKKKKAKPRGQRGR